jgi:hypothetical protein
MSKSSTARFLKSLKKKYDGELSGRWKCGTWFVRSDDEIDKDDQTEFPASAKFYCRKL